MRTAAIIAIAMLLAVGAPGCTGAAEKKAEQLEQQLADYAAAAEADRKEREAALQKATEENRALRRKLDEVLDDVARLLGAPYLATNEDDDQ